MARGGAALLFVVIALLMHARHIEVELAPIPRASRPECAEGSVKPCARSRHTRLPSAHSRHARLRGGSNFYSSDDVEEWDQLAQTTDNTFEEPCVLPHVPCQNRDVGALSCPHEPSPACFLPAAPAC